MSRVFAYARVSTVEQLTENQREQITAAGYRIEARRYVEEKISGSVPAQQRPGFKKLLERWNPATRSSSPNSIASDEVRSTCRRRWRSSSRSRFD